MDLATVRRMIDQGQAGPALDALDRLFPTDAALPAARRLRVAALLDLDRWEQAATEARDTLALTGPDPDLLGQLGAALHCLGDLPGAERALLDALALEPGDVWLLCRYAQLCLAAGELDKGTRLLHRAAAVDPDAAIVHATRVHLAVARGDQRAAALASQDFLDAHPEHPAAQALKGRARPPRPDDPYRSHPLLRPLLPLRRLGPLRSWLAALAIIIVLRWLGLRPLIGPFVALWLIYCVYSWVAPGLVRRLVRRPRAE